MGRSMRFATSVGTSICPPSVGTTNAIVGTAQGVGEDGGRGGRLGPSLGSTSGLGGAVGGTAIMIRASKNPFIVIPLVSAPLRTTELYCPVSSVLHTRRPGESQDTSTPRSWWLARVPGTKTRTQIEFAQSLFLRSLACGIQCRFSCQESTGGFAVSNFVFGFGFTGSDPVTHSFGSWSDLKVPT